jgi:hypothetical protein
MPLLERLLRALMRHSLSKEIRHTLERVRLFLIVATAASAVALVSLLIIAVYFLVHLIGGH